MRGKPGVTRRAGVVEAVVAGARLDGPLVVEEECGRARREQRLAIFIAASPRAALG